MSKKIGKGKTKNESVEDTKKPYVDFINNICNDDYANAKTNLQSIMDMKLKEKISKSASKTQKT